MASDHEQTPPDHAAEEPTRPTQPYHPGQLPPTGAGLVENQSYANAVFKRNSERLQQDATARQEARHEAGGEDQLGEDRTPSAPNYAALKQEHADAADRSADNEPEHQAEAQQEAGADNQAASKEDKIARFREMMQEAGGQTFARDQSRSAER